MKRYSLVALAALAVSAMSACSAPVAGRHIRLGHETGTPDRVRFLSQSIQLSDGAKTSWITLTRVGQFHDPRYGDFEITHAMLAQMVGNFDNRVLGQDVFIDVAHKPDDGAAAKVLRLSVEDGRLRALVEWTPFGVRSVKEKGFTYLSAEYHEAWQDNEQKQQHGCVLLGAGLTNRPVISRLDGIDPKQLSQDDNDHDAPVRVAISPQLLKELQEQDMNHIEQLRAHYKTLGLSDDVIVKLLAEAKKQFDAAGTDSVKLLSVLESWKASGDAVSSQLRALAAANPGSAQAVTITLAQPAMDVNEAVKLAMKAADDAKKLAQTTLATKVKLLSDTIKDGHKELDDTALKSLVDKASPLITAESTDEQVKGLAQIQLDHVKALSAQAKLQGLGYVHIPGDARISVDSSNSIKSLQATIDKRLGFEGMSETRRFEKTGGKLLAANKDFAEKALAQFDAENGARLDAEHKMLAGGTGSISDVAVPAVAERTVLREALYNLTSLGFMDVGTAPLANVITVPFSYRDTAAAGVNALRRYEGQGIRRAGVIQTSEEARPLPQKLAYLVSSELRLLMSASPIDFDPVAENIRNIIRIVGEDTEAINFNELVFSADESGAVAFNDTLTAQCNGANAVFVTSAFPVVRPRQPYDLKGNPVGNPTNPLVLTYDGTVRTEYALPSDGSALPAGIYYVMDWNLGEFRLVNQAGVVQVPAAGKVLTVAGSRATNRSVWNSDAVGGETVKERYDRLLTEIGNRKVVINNDRFYTSNFTLMSGALDNALTTAESFQANGQRVGTGLSADGSVGFTKNLPTFNPSAPGLVMGDTRIMVGQRGNSRFRMCKAFSMNPPEQVRNAAGLFTDQQEGFGTQWIVSHTPTPLKNSLTSIIVYSATGRVARAA
ncbi:phage protease [Acidovorax sp. sif1233]|uniref:phage protease n=1 Tax=Acidovorax sp. sif1233 TaxID=2854792 RepID=UPI001C48130A|nr:phage protease [Acidovorax sp. sif1233]MBV7454296.1 phage protease [Acidovorax sp. sif1233]